MKNEQTNYSNIIKSVSHSHQGLIYHSIVVFTKIFNKSNLQRKKATSALDFFGSTPVERESKETFANKRKQVNN